MQLIGIVCSLALCIYHYVYILKTADGYFNKTYVGYSTDVFSRLKKHNSSKGAKATRGHEWEIIFIKKFSLKSKALSFEYQLKKDIKKYINLKKYINYYQNIICFENPNKTTDELFFPSRRTNFQR